MTYCGKSSTAGHGMSNKCGVEVWGAGPPIHQCSECATKDLELAVSTIKDQQSRIAELEKALQRIVEWDELSVKWRADNGSNGQRDYYRSLASEALTEIK